MNIRNNEAQIMMLKRGEHKERISMNNMVQHKESAAGEEETQANRRLSNASDMRSKNARSLKH